MNSPLASLQVAVLMRREKVQGAMSRWQNWRWALDDVVQQESAFGTEARCLHRDETGERWLHPGFTVGLYRDDPEGYYLNLTSTAPCWFVLWRMEEAPVRDAEPIARPHTVTLSYHDAGRWLDAQETVEQVPAPAEVIQWLQSFVDEHHKPEPKRRQRPQSFRSLSDRFGSPASVSTGWKRKGDGEQG
jgi:hypothetical protein